MRRELPVQHAIHLALGSRPDVRLWRFDAAAAWINGRPKQHCPEGWPDLAGWVVIGGQPVVLGIEVKAPKGGKHLDSQKTMQRIWEQFGAIYILARSVEEAAQKLEAAIAERS